MSLVDASLDFWLTSGRFCRQLEKGLAEFVGVSECRLVNSGSSANLLAFSTLTSPRLGDRRIRPWRRDHHRCRRVPHDGGAGHSARRKSRSSSTSIPVTDNIDTSMLESAISEPRTKAVMVAHTLGNPFDIDAVLDFCEAHGLWLVEDNCDAMGSEYTTVAESRAETRRTGTFGHLATSSFYPAHQMTTGEGGAVYTSDEELRQHRRVHPRLGPGLLLPARAFEHVREAIRLVARHATRGLRPQIHLFPLRLQPQDDRHAGRCGGCPTGEAPFVRRGPPAELRLPPSTVSRRFSDVLRLPEADGLLDTELVRLPLCRASRNGGHPGQSGRSAGIRSGPDSDALRRESGSTTLFRRDAGIGSRVSSDRSTCANTDRLMNDAFWFGVYPGMTEAHLDHICTTIENHLAEKEGVPR